MFNGPNFEEWVDWATSQPADSSVLKSIRREDPATYYNHVLPRRNKMRNVYDKRKVRLEEFTRDGYIPLFGGRPDRETVISGDDITNLMIALNTSASMAEFVSAV